MRLVGQDVRLHFISSKIAQRKQSQTSCWWILMAIHPRQQNSDKFWCIIDAVTQPFVDMFSNINQCPVLLCYLTVRVVLWKFHWIHCMTMKVLSQPCHRSLEDYKLVHEQLSQSPNTPLKSSTQCLRTAVQRQTWPWVLGHGTDYLVWATAIASPRPKARVRHVKNQEEDRELMFIYM